VLLEHFVGLLSSLTKSSLAAGFYTLQRRSLQLSYIEGKIRERSQLETEAKLFYKWFERYFREAEKSMKVYYRNLKGRAFNLLNLHRRKMLIRTGKAVQLRRQSLKFRGFRAWLYRVQEIRTKRREGLVKPKMVEVRPIIDKDISQAYIPKEQRTLGNISQSMNEQVVFNVFGTQNQLNPLVYRTGGSTLDENNRSQNHVSTLSRNYSPVRADDPSFTWRLVKNQNSSSMSNINRSNGALYSAVTDKNARPGDTSIPLSTIQNRNSESASIKQQKRVHYSPGR